MPTTFAEVKALVGQLDVADRARLLDQLSVDDESLATIEAADEAVANLRRVMDRIKIAPLSGTEMLFLDRESRSCTLSMLASGLAHPHEGSASTP